MPSYTLPCRITVGRGDYSLRWSYVPVGVAAETRCCIPMNRRGSLSVSKINLLGRPYSDKKCITYCFEAGNLALICPGAQQRFTSDRLAVVLVSVKTHFAVVDTNIGNINSYDMRCVVPTYQFGDIGAVAVGANTHSHELLCKLLIAAQTSFDLIPVDIGYQMRVVLRCITQGELHDTLNCAVSTPTKVTDRGCLVHLAAEPDAYTELTCRIPRLIGDPVEYVSVEVVLGKRHIDDMRCSIVVPPSNYSELQCATSFVLQGQPRWNRYLVGDDIYVRLMNVGSMDIANAVLQDNTNTVEAAERVRMSSLWQLRFKKPAGLSKNYVIVVTLEPGHKIIVIDKPKSEFSV